MKFSLISSSSAIEEGEFLQGNNETKFPKLFTKHLMHNFFFQLLFLVSIITLLQNNKDDAVEFVKPYLRQRHCV